MTWVGQVCERCGEWAACWDGICQECIPSLDVNPIATSPPPTVRNDPLECVNCGREITGPNEMCPRCHERISADLDYRWKTRN